MRLWESRLSAPWQTSHGRAGPQWQEQRRLEAELDNFGVHKVERLAGNVGYLALHFLHRPEWGGETISAALTSLTRSAGEERFSADSPVGSAK